MKWTGLALGIALMTAAAHGQATTQSSAWEEKDYGQQILRAFDHAPYPHPSRAQGFTRDNIFYPVAGHYDDSTVGVVIPNGYHPSDTVNYVVHFHGNDNHVSKVLEVFKLGEQLAASKVSAILLVPQGPKDVPEGGYGKLELDENGLKNLLEEVTRFLREEGKIKTDRIGKVALSAHSAGYKVTASVLDHGGMGDCISDVLLLDASHAPHVDWFAKWAAADKDHRLVSVFRDYLKPGAKALMDALDKSKVEYQVLDEATVTPEQLRHRGVTFIPVDMAHNDVPVKTELFRRLLETSALAKQRTSP